MDWRSFGGGKKPTTTPVSKPRQPRSDKRVRSTLRIASQYDDMIKAIAFNHSTSKQKVVDRIIRMILESDTLRSQLIYSMPKAQKNPYILMRD